jgi:hypothetical protein
MGGAVSKGKAGANAQAEALAAERAEIDNKLRALEEREVKLHESERQHAEEKKRLAADL